ncbi:MAG: class I SAM-dependent methyltransferase [Candidatus Diapherotrites archaeon]|nr:class I SAM-dependent methyltransferase [Candidatus Diapherotrites archaeon]
MAIEPFEEHSLEYDKWFVKHKYTYLSELEAIKSLLPNGEGVEIGVGTGRFAGPLGIKIGVEPSENMSKIAEKRGVKIIPAAAEDIPISDLHFDYALIVTTICFLDDVGKALRETHRILKDGGYILIGFIDRDSKIGKAYEKHKEASVFYRNARFFSTKEVVSLLAKVGFTDFQFVQTLFRELNSINSLEPVKEGYGAGSFVVVRGRKPKTSY